MVGRLVIEAKNFDVSLFRNLNEMLEETHMSMDYIRRTYGVPAKRGARIRFDGVFGQFGITGCVIGSRNQYLRVRMDSTGLIWTLHPTWQVQYLKTPNFNSTTR